MNTTIINRNAQFIKHLLSDNRQWSYVELKQASGLSDREINAAIGWLAHEGSICFIDNCGINRLCKCNCYFG